MTIKCNPKEYQDGRKTSELVLTKYLSSPSASNRSLKWIPREEHVQSTYHTSLDSRTFFFFFSLPWFVCSVILSGFSKCLSCLPLNPCILPLEKTFGMQIPRSLQVFFVVFPPLSFIKDQNCTQYLE